MSYKVVRSEEAVAREIVPTYHAHNFITKEISPNFSLAVNEAKDHQETETTEYDRIYYVIEGIIVFDFDGDHAEVKAGDSCFISKGTTYDFGGTFKAVVVNQPAFGV
ncbi:cupin domain-containing protein [Patescibacteria group bacterium]|nr:MAG: cupin domain-containing protein [Patescibacteria group bacterium]